jgi:sterol desaturase/sphingolipid hydroxylase (fatty acid hydroxylase superfamily)
MDFNTPSHDRVHHASNREYLDRNYGGILIIWDRLFGTFAQEQPRTKVTYGVVHPAGSLNPVRIAFHEWGAVLRDLGPAQSGRPGDRLASLAQSPCPKP